jgi:ankyrin repeat protein
LVESDTDVNFKPSGYTFAAVGFAIRQGNSAALTLLLENGADLQVTSLNEETPLAATIESAEVNMFCLLLNAGVSRDHANADFDYYIGMADSRTFSFAVDLLREWRERSRVSYEPLEAFQSQISELYIQ